MIPAALIGLFFENEIELLFVDKFICRMYANCYWAFTVFGRQS